MRVAIVGPGRMGAAIRREAERRGHPVVATIGREENPTGDGITRERLAGAEVVFEFTRPDAAVTNLERLMRLGQTVVTGTTGWTADLPRLARLAQEHHAALLHAANFSIGVQVLRHAAGAAAALLRGRPEFDAALREQHHRRKLDAPSGTALALQAELRAADPSREFPITSQRLGWAPGTHEVVIDAEYETITLSHVVRDRAVFAAGAVLAGEWLAGRRGGGGGVFTFDQVLTGDAP
jgi:4-hydroxy-tetrahydrodipicolinate reductase